MDLSIVVWTFTRGCLLVLVIFHRLYEFAGEHGFTNQGHVWFPPLRLRVWDGKTLVGQSTREAKWAGTNTAFKLQMQIWIHINLTAQKVGNGASYLKCVMFLFGGLGVSMEMSSFHRKKVGDSWHLPKNAEEHRRTAGGPSFSGRDPRCSCTGGAGCARQHGECGIW